MRVKGKLPRAKGMGEGSVRVRVMFKYVDFQRYKFETLLLRTKSTVQQR